eukprot:7424782-Karenia_brevis.AAC.1
MHLWYSIQKAAIPATSCKNKTDKCGLHTPVKHIRMRFRSRSRVGPTWPATRSQPAPRVFALTAPSRDL